VCSIQHRKYLFSVTALFLSLSMMSCGESDIRSQDTRVTLSTKNCATPFDERDHKTWIEDTDVTLWPGGNLYFKFDSSLELLEIDSSGGITDAKKKELEKKNAHIQELRDRFYYGCSLWEQSGAPVKCVEVGENSNSQKNYVVVIDGGESDTQCGRSYVGMIGGPQGLWINCWRKSTIAHEVGHAFGRQHEHLRADDFVDGIRRRRYVLFTSNFKYQKEAISGFCPPWEYDYFSVMHYSFFHGIVPTHPILFGKQGGEKPIFGTLSPLDKEAIRSMYEVEVTEGVSQASSLTATATPTPATIQTRTPVPTATHMPSPTSTFIPTAVPTSTFIPTPAPASTSTPVPTLIIPTGLIQKRDGDNRSINQVPVYYFIGADPTTSKQITLSKNGSFQLPAINNRPLTEQITVAINGKTVTNDISKCYDLPESAYGCVAISKTVGELIQSNNSYGTIVLERK